MSLNVSAVVVSGLGKCYETGGDKQNNLREKIYSAFSLKKKEPANEKFWALRNINFEITHGEVVGIIGANGAGKSTLLKLLAEVTEPTEGCIQFNGKVASILEIGTGFHPDLTGIENIYLSGSLLGMSSKEIDQRVTSIVEFSELGEFAYRPVKNLSSGMFLRLAFSVCTHLDADILLLDEVVSVGDAAFSIKSLQHIRGIAAQGKTIILASHDLSSVQNICNRCILLDGGNLADIGQTSELIEKYIEHSVIKSLLQKSGREADEQNLLITDRSFKDKSGKGLMLHRCFVRNENGEASNFLMKNALCFTCVFEKYDDAEVVLSIILNYNLSSAVLSAAHFNHKGVTSVDIREKGEYKLHCLFPSHFFNHGYFSADICFTSKEGIVMLSQQNALVFKIGYADFSSAEVAYDGKFNGALYPRLDWKIEKTN